jgi:hypothetical protein
MKPISTTSSFRAATKNSSAKRINRRLVPVKRMVMTLLIFTVFFSGCKRIGVQKQEAGDADASNQPNLKTASGGADFTIAVIPDTQYYVAEHQLGGTVAMFQAQIDWIKLHRIDSNIVYVAGLGDIVDDGDNPDSAAVEWPKVVSVYAGLESPVDIPFGLAVGNHDQSPNGQPITGTTTKYNQYFGVSHFQNKSYYGGHYGSNNDSHFDLFTAGGLNFIVIYIEYDNDTDEDASTSEAMNTWAYNLTVTYASRKAIIVSHTIMGNNVGAGNNDGTPGSFSDQGLRIHNRLKSRPNVFMMLNGHHGANGEGFRQDTYSGRTIKTFLSDYQGRVNGGGGLMRLYKISVNNDLISVKTINAYTGGRETDGDSQFTKPLFHEQTTTRTCNFAWTGLSQLSFFNAGVWKVNGMGNVTYGSANQGDIPTPGDYNADGKADFSVWRPNPTTGSPTWYVKLPTELVVAYGLAGDIPVPGDYDGDGKCDIALYRPSGTTSFHWYINGQTGYTYGVAGAIPVPGDYNGDGKVDPAYYVPSTGMWNVMGLITNKHYGSTGYIPVPGDYNGDGTTDVAIFDPATGIWHLDPTNTGVNDITILAPLSGDMPAPGDYDGLGKTQPAIYRPSANALYIYHYTTGTYTTVSYTNVAGNKLLNLPYCIRKFFFP